MPRRIPPSDYSESEAGENISISIRPIPLLAKEWGAKQWFEMCKATGKAQECPICLESCLECQSCLALLVPCFHTVHYKCLFSMQNPECPVCRPSNKS